MSNTVLSKQTIGSSPSGVVDMPAVKQPLPSGTAVAEIVFAAVPSNRVMEVTLPPDFPVGPVEVIVISRA